MPQVRGIKCEVCSTIKLDGDADCPDREWNIIGVTNGNEGIGIYLGPGAGIPGDRKHEAHYLCSASCLFSHIAKLLKIDPTALHR